MTIKTSEKIPTDFWDCAIDAGHCKGLPRCAKDSEIYQSTVSDSITVNIEDINNNPPRFFNEVTKKLINEEPVILDCESCPNYVLGKIEETGDATSDTFRR